MTVSGSILGLGDVRKLGRPGGMAVLYYLSTTVLTVVLGPLPSVFIYSVRATVEHCAFAGTVVMNGVLCVLLAPFTIRVQQSPNT